MNDALTARCVGCRAARRQVRVNQSRGVRATIMRLPVAKISINILQCRWLAMAVVARAPSAAWRTVTSARPIRRAAAHDVMTRTHTTSDCGAHRESENERISALVMPLFALFGCKTHTVSSNYRQDSQRVRHSSETRSEIMKPMGAGISMRMHALITVSAVAIFQFKGGIGRTRNERRLQVQE